MRTLSMLIIVLLLNSLKVYSQVKDTITSFQDSKLKSAIFKSPSGKDYIVRFLDDKYPQSENNGNLILMSHTDNISKNCDTKNFIGIDRKAAKTSYATTAIIEYASIGQLLTHLTPGAVMTKKVNKTSTRIAEENKNVRLKSNIFLFAFKKEGDNDFHIIIGDNKDVSKARLLNVEISGLPDPPVQQFQTVRDTFEKQFGKVCISSYAIFTGNPIPIQVEGSIFYDIDHKPGEVGPSGLLPKTSWEIHPISKIVFNN